ncbi:hypothetical protein [Pleionea sp. CnH1-48]|uniref:hypothetical protein n=1 Tax=Pleionea sp. CnH1-48 TaxID=2954494 RepID=UPI002096AC16|nr:hypothetical protein [Pleionea sp. CnH1-48]MCO7226273.1 hypothetical protein [Pleionea sp. CnH1-48]
MNMNHLIRLAAIGSILAIAGCETQRDYSSLKIVTNTRLETIGNQCEALGSKDYDWYKYTCDGWTTPAERCFRSEQELMSELAKTEADPENSCRVLSVIRSR